MRSLRVLVVIALSSSVLAVGPAAGAAERPECEVVLAHLVRPAPVLDPNAVVSNTGGTLTVHSDAVVSYALAVVAYVSGIADYVSDRATCVVDNVVEYERELMACLRSTPAVANLKTSDPAARYVQVIGGAVSVHYANVTGDVAAIAACAA